MTRKIECVYLPISHVHNIKVRVLRAPFVDTRQLQEVVLERKKAVDLKAYDL